MANRLEALERELQKGRLRQPKPRPVPGRRRPQAQAMGAVRVRPTALEIPVDYQVPGLVPALAQDSSKSCWATVFTMLKSWKDEASYSVAEAVASVDKRWRDVYVNNTGLLARDKVDFLAQAGLVAEPPMSLTTEGWENLLRDFGPLWVTTDEKPDQPGGIHGRVITGIRGDGSADGTQLSIIDPNGGREYQESVATFLPKFEAEARKDIKGPLRIQVVHWPRDARVSVSQWTRARSWGGAAWAGALAAPPGESVQQIAQRIGGELPQLTEQLLAQGVPEQQIAEFLRQYGSAPVPKAEALGAVTVHLPGTTVLEGWQATLFMSMLKSTAMATPGIGPFMAMVLESLPALCKQFNVTVGIGPAASGGGITGLGGGVGIVFTPDERVGFYGSFGPIAGFIASLSLTVQVTVIKGGAQNFGGRAEARGITADLAEGVTGGVHALYNPNNEFMGITAEVGVTAGLSPIEAMIQYQETTTTFARGLMTAIRVTALSEPSSPPADNVAVPGMEDIPMTEAELADGEPETLVREQRLPVEAFQKGKMTAADARWAADDVSPDYRHLDESGRSQMFNFDANDLVQLAALNHMQLPQASTDLIIFGLRGCTPTGTYDTFVDAIEISEDEPDYINNRCLLGVWRRSDNKMVAFQASTVPNWKNMERQRRSANGRSANLMPTGRYEYVVGTHRAGSARPQPGALRQDYRVVVLRSKDDLTHTVHDEWDSAVVNDNIHAGRNNVRAAAFSSAGCQTVPGDYNAANTKPLTNTSWARFRKALGLDNKNPANDAGKRFTYMMLTGRDARLLQSRDPSSLMRLRFGSSGPSVTALQSGLKSAGHYNGSVDGQFGAGTAQAYIRWQQQQDSTADCIVTPDLGRQLGFDMIKGQSIK